MKDREPTAELEEDTRTLSGVEQMSVDSSPTESGIRKLDDPSRSGNASYSLGRLEEDLRTLHSKWQAVEREIAERDEQIGGLRQQMNQADATREAIEADLDRMAAEKESLASELLEQKREFERDLERREKSSSKANDRVNEIESENTSLRVHLQELQAYIDGRKQEWADLKAKLSEYEDTIGGMSDTLDSHNSVVATKEEEKAALAHKVMELERELAELKGRHAEKESSQSELQQNLDDKSRELGELNAQLIGLQKDIDKLQKKVQRKDETLRSLRSELKDRERDSTSLEELLAGEKTASAKVQAKLDAAQQRVMALESELRERDSASDELGMTVGELRERLRQSEPTLQRQEQRIAELEAKLRARQAAEDVLRDEVTQAAGKLDEVTAKASDYEIRAAELHAMLLETQSERKSVEEELEAQRELVHVLEQELAGKQDNLDLLDRSVERLSAIHSEVRDLDFQIDDHWVKNPAKEDPSSAEIFEAPDEVLIEPAALLDAEDESSEHVLVAVVGAGDEEQRFPLCGREITIGRSRRSDVRLNSKYISRIHARIRVDGERAIIEDAGSTNGFLVNSVETKQHALVDGDRLEIGDRKLRYLHAAAAS